MYHRRTSTSRTNALSIRIFKGNPTTAEAPQNPKDNESLVMVMLAVISIPLASSALVLRAAIWLGLSFHIASCVLAAVAIAILALAGVRLLTTRPRPGVCIGYPDKTAILVLSAACLAAALSVVCLHRSDADDVIYLPKIVYAVAHPGVQMDGVIHEIAHTPSLALPLSAAPYYPTAYEFSQAAFAHLTGIDLLWIYYVLAPVLAAIFGVLLLAANLRFLGLSGRASAVAALILIPLLLMMGESHRSVGNFTLLRLFQAKCSFIFLGLPLFIAVSILFFRKPSLDRWALLIAGVVAVSGMTTSALVMLPLLSLPLFLSWWLAFGHGESLRSSIIRGLAYAAALLPTLIFALDYRRYAAARVAYGSSINAGFPQSFHGQFNLVTGGSALSPSILLCLLSILVLGCSWREARHRFLLALAALVAIFYLHPWIAPMIMRYLTTENIYWRLFYLVPLPLMIGAAVGLLFDRVAGGWLMRRGVPFLFFIALSAAVFVSPTSVMHHGNHVMVSAQGYPLDTSADEARACLEIAEPGVVLAPIVLAQNMAVLSAQHSQVVTRADFLRNALFDAPEEFAQRMSAAAVISGNGGHFGDFVAVMEDLKPSTVVVSRKALSPAMVTTLKGEGLHQDGTVGRWIVYGRIKSAETGIRGSIAPGIL